MPLTHADRLRALTASAIIFGALGFVGTMFAVILLLLHEGDDTNILLDCTQPSGECYQRSQEQTAKAVDALINNQESIKAVVQLTQFCVDNILPPEYELVDLQHCVERLIPNADPTSP